MGQSEVMGGLHAVLAGRHPGDGRSARGALATGRRPRTSLHWSMLGAERLVAQLPPPSAAGDLPAPLVRLLREQPELARTLAAFLDAAGDVKATAEALSLHRSGLYYRLRRIEALSGLELDSGEDRLLAHLAVRLARLE